MLITAAILWQKSRLTRRLSSLESKNHLPLKVRGGPLKNCPKRTLSKVVLYISRGLKWSRGEDAQPHFEFVFLAKGTGFPQHLTSRESKVRKRRSFAGPQNRALVTTE